MTPEMRQVHAVTDLQIRSCRNTRRRDCTYYSCTTQAFHRLSTRCSTWKISCDKQKQRSLLRRQTLVRCFCQQRFDLKHRNPFPRLAITSTFSAPARNVGLQSLLKSLRLCTITRGERFSIRSQQSNPNGFDIPGLMLLQALQDVSIV